MSPDEKNRVAADVEDGTSSSVRPRRKWRGLAVFLLGLFAFAVALLLSLPRWLSTAPARRLVLNKVRASSGVDVDVASWRLTWRNGLVFTDVHFADEAQGLLVEVPELTVTSGLLDLYGPTCRVGRVELISPQVTVLWPQGTEREPSRPSGVESESLPDGPTGSDERPGEAATAVKPRDLTALLVMTNGVCEIRFADRPPVVVSNCNGRVGIPSLSGPMAFRLGAAPQAGGVLAAQGVLQSAAGGIGDDWGGQVDFSAAEIPLELVGAFTDGAIDMDGALSASVRLEGSAADWMGKGRFGVFGLAIQNLPGTSDSLRAPDVSLVVAASGDEKGISVSALKVESSLGELDAGGYWYPRESQWACQGDLAFNWAQLATCLPRTLRLQDTLKPLDGQVRLGWDLAHSRASSGGRLAASVSNVAAEVNGRTVKLGAPIKLAAAAQWTGSGVTVEAVDLSASFANVHGRGDARGFQLTATGDVARAVTEAEQFFDLGGLRASGRFTGALSVNCLPTNSAIVSNWALTDLVLACDTNPPVELGTVGLSVTGEVAVARDGSLEGVEKVGVTLRSRLLTASAAADAIHWRQDESGGLAVSSLVWQAATDLREVRRTLLPVRAWPLDLSVRGQLGAKGRIAGTRNSGWSLSSSLVGEQVVADNGKVSVYEQSVSVQAAARLLPGGVDVERFSLQCSLLDIEGSGTWKVPPSSRGICRASGELTADYQRISDLLLALTPLELDASGRRAAPFSLEVPIDARRGWLWSEARAEIPLELERVRGYGIEIGELRGRPLRLENGVADLDVASTANGGTLRLPLQLAFTRSPMVLKLKAPTDVLAGVKISDDLADTCLSRLHPVFSECSMLSGHAGLRAESFEMPLVSNAVDVLTYEGGLSLSNTVLKAKGPLLELLTKTGVPVQEVRLPDQSLALEVEEGWVSASALTSRIDTVSVVLVGRVRLDGTLDYVAEVPVSREWVSDRVWPYLKDLRLKVNLKGTLKDPKVSSEELKHQVEGLAKEALKRVLQDRGGDLLEKLFR